MPHIYESEFQTAVADYFREQRGVEGVETEVWQPDPEWYVDIVVQFPWTTLFIEVENDEDAIREGMKQAEGYAAESPRKGVPMVVVPPDHLNSDKVARLVQSGTTVVREFDMDENAFVR